METPRYYECMNPILTALREGGGTLTNDEIVDAVANLMHLPDDVMNRKQQGHNMGEVAYRIAWAKSYLKKAGYLTQSTRGVWALTAEGKSADAVDVRAILTDVRIDYVTRRTEKEPPPTVLEATGEGASAAIAEVEEELGWKQQVPHGLLDCPLTPLNVSVSACYGSAASRKWRSRGARAMGVSTARGSCGLGA